MNGGGGLNVWDDQKIEVPEPAPPNKNKDVRLRDLLSVERNLLGEAVTTTSVQLMIHHNESEEYSVAMGRWQCF